MCIFQVYKNRDVLRNAPGSFPGKPCLNRTSGFKPRRCIRDETCYSEGKNYLTSKFLLYSFISQREKTFLEYKIQFSSFIDIDLFCDVFLMKI